MKFCTMTLFLALKITYMLFSLTAVILILKVTAVIGTIAHLTDRNCLWFAVMVTVHTFVAQKAPIDTM